MAMLARLGDAIYWVAALTATLIVIADFIFAIADSRIEGLTGALFIFAASGVIATVVFCRPCVSSFAAQIARRAYPLWVIRTPFSA